jgi:hypothetical protein
MKYALHSNTARDSRASSSAEGARAEVVRDGFGGSAGSGRRARALVVGSVVGRGFIHAH